MPRNRKSKKKKNNLKIISTLLLLVVLIAIGYGVFTKWIIPQGERYKEKPTRVEEIPYKEEEEEEEVTPPPVEEMVEVNLYFSDEEGMYLVSEKRRIPQTTSLAKQVVLELIRGPETPHLYPTIPEGTQLSELYVAGNIAYLDFSEEIIKNHSGGSSGEIMTVYSLVNTLTEIPPIEGVQILVAGEERESLAGHLDISRPLLRDEEWIQP